MLENPPPIGVVTGPFKPMPVRSIDSVSALGMYSPYLANASEPAANDSHSILTPEASTMRVAARVTSGPIPSPGINVTLCVITFLLGAGFSFGRFGLVIFSVEQLLKLGVELAHIFKIAINRGKPDISYFI